MTHTQFKPGATGSYEAVKPHQMLKGQVWKQRPALKYNFSISCIFVFPCLHWSSLPVWCCQSRTRLTDCMFLLPGQGKLCFPSAACLAWRWRCGHTSRQSDVHRCGFAGSSAARCPCSQPAEACKCVIAPVSQDQYSVVDIRWMGQVPLKNKEAVDSTVSGVISVSDHCWRRLCSGS